MREKHDGQARSSCGDRSGSRHRIEQEMADMTINVIVFNNIITMVTNTISITLQGA